MKASIVIPVYNAAATIAHCIEACLRQDYPEVEIIIVDDGSTDETRAVVQRYPVTYLYQSNSGPAAARNRGWWAATGEIICFTDSDCVPDRAWVSTLVKAYEDEIGGVGGTYDIANGDNLLAACIHQEIAQRHLKMPQFVNYLGSFNASYRRIVLEQVGGFNESYRIASGEDNDLAYSVIKHGYKLAFTRQAQVAHYHPDKLIRYLRQQYKHGYWRMQIYRNHPAMARGDSYGGLTDFLQPPLALLLLALLPLIFLPVAAYLIMFLVASGLALTLPLTLAVVKRTGQPKYLTLAPISFIRAYARGLGMALGIFRFFVLESLRKPNISTEPDKVLNHSS